jgi:hypothetical protein
MKEILEELDEKLLELQDFTLNLKPQDEAQA